MGNRAGKAMALKIKDNHNKTQISHMYHPATKDKLSDLQAITHAFSHYYNILYNLKEDTLILQPSKSKMYAFLGEMNLQSISQAYPQINLMVQMGSLKNIISNLR